MTFQAPDCGSAPPVPVPDLLILPFEEGLRAGTMSSRFLVDSGMRQRVVGADLQALLLLLSQAPASWETLAVRYAEVTGRAVDSAELRNEVLGLPADWFRGQTAASPKRSPFLLQWELVSGDRVAPLTRRLALLFRWWIAAPVILAFLVVEAIALPSAARHMHDHAGAANTVLLFAGLAVTMVLHELGHLSACARSGGKHGGMGVGLYWVFPAMYAEVSQAWRLSPKARVLVDAGGIYFQSFTAIAIGAYAVLADDPFAYRLLWLVTFAMLHTLNPFFKFDGYWLLSDATGLTNLHAQVRRTVAGLVGRLFGLRVPEPREGEGMRMVVLHAYTVMCGLYLVFILHFLHGEIVLAAQSYPHLVTAAVGEGARAFAGNDFRTLAGAAGDVLVASAWPACLATFGVVMCWWMLKRVGSILRELASGLRVVGDQT